MSETSPEHEKQLKKILASCLTGSVVQAYETLKTSPQKSKPLQQFEKKFHNRFFKDPPVIRVSVKDKELKEIIRIYCRYFVDVLTESLSAEAAENKLFQALSELLKTDFKDMDALELDLVHLFAAKGYQFLGGKTLPHYGPYIWQTTDTQLYEVGLPDNGFQALKVHFVSDFVLCSWLDYATFGEYSTGGWAKPEGLYCVAERYADKMDSPEYIVSYLKHEAQHYADYKAFPKLMATDLEYRAKLVELIYYPDLSRLKAFLQEAAPVGSPHTTASWFLTQQLSLLLWGQRTPPIFEAWQTCDHEQIKRAAETLYKLHSKALKRKGAEQIQGFWEA